MTDPTTPTGTPEDPPDAGPTRHRRTPTDPTQDAPAGGIRAIRITADGDLDVITIPARYDAVADAVGAAHHPGDIGITSAATWKAPGPGHLTLWTGHGGGPHNQLATLIADQLVPVAEGSIDRISDGIRGGALAGTVVLVGYRRDTGTPADLGDVAVERVRGVVDGRLQARQDAAAREADTTSLDVTPATGELPTVRVRRGGAVMDLVQRMRPDPEPGGPDAAGGGS